MVSLQSTVVLCTMVTAPRKLLDQTRNLAIWQRVPDCLAVRFLLNTLLKSAG